MINKSSVTDNTSYYIKLLDSYGLDTSTIEYEGTIKSYNKITIRCNNGHTIETNINAMKGTKKCIECKRLSYFYETCKELESEGNIILSNEKDYIKTTSKLEYLCSRGHVAKISVNSLRDGSRCRKCRDIETGNRYRLNIDDIKSIFEDNDYEILSDVNTYKNVSTRFIVKCPSNHEYETSVSNFRSGYRCRTCQYINQTGESNSSWLGGTKLLRESLRQYILPWKRESMKNCNYKCILSGIGDIEIHHLVNFNEILNMFFELHNIEIKKTLYEYDDEIESFIISEFPKYHDKFGLGVCINVELHKLFHKIYLKKNNTPEQFEEFKQDYLNGKYDYVLPENLKSTTTQKTKN